MKGAKYFAISTNTREETAEHLVYYQSPKFWAEGNVVW